MFVTHFTRRKITVCSIALTGVVIWLVKDDPRNDIKSLYYIKAYQFSFRHAAFDLSLPLHLCLARHCVRKLVFSKGTS
jgi:hypothetical protein